MPWDQCTQLSCSSEYKTLHRCNQWWRWSALFFTGREPPACTRHCLMLLPRLLLAQQVIQNGGISATNALFSMCMCHVFKVAIEVPYILFQTLIYGIIVYATIGFHWTAAKFLWYIFFMYFTLLYFTYYGMMAVGMTPNHEIASIVSAAFYAIWNLFCGFLIPRQVSQFLSNSRFSCVYTTKLSCGLCREFRCGGGGTTGGAL